jgi:hypothetical protein
MLALPPNGFPPLYPGAYGNSKYGGGLAAEGVALPLDPPIKPLQSAYDNESPSFSSAAKLNVKPLFTQIAATSLVL